jgi:Protein of unknown function (DUF2946)
MSRRFRKSLANHTIISLLLMSLGIRGLIPVGFMPSTDHAFTLQVCPHAAGMQMAQPAGHQGHGSNGSHGEHCPFATSAAGAPTPHIAQLVASSALDVRIQLQRAEPVRAVRRFQIQQPRAPPDLV